MPKTYEQFLENIVEFGRDVKNKRALDNFSKLAADTSKSLGAKDAELRSKFGIIRDSFDLLYNDKADHRNDEPYKQKWANALDNVIAFIKALAENNAVRDTFFTNVCGDDTEKIKKTNNDIIALTETLDHFFNAGIGKEKQKSALDKFLSDREKEISAKNAKALENKGWVIGDDKPAPQKKTLKQSENTLFSENVFNTPAINIELARLFGNRGSDQYDKVGDDLEKLRRASLGLYNFRAKMGNGKAYSQKNFDKLNAYIEKVKKLSDDLHKSCVAYYEHKKTSKGGSQWGPNNKNENAKKRIAAVQSAEDLANKIDEWIKLKEADIQKTYEKKFRKAAAQAKAVQGADAPMPMVYFDDWSKKYPHSSDEYKKAGKPVPDKITALEKNLPGIDAGNVVAQLLFVDIRFNHDIMPLINSMNDLRERMKPASELKNIAKEDWTRRVNEDLGIIRSAVTKEGLFDAVMDTFEKKENQANENYEEGLDYKHEYRKNFIGQLRSLNKLFGVNIPVDELEKKYSARKNGKNLINNEPAPDDNRINDDPADNRINNEPEPAKFTLDDIVSLDTVRRKEPEPVIEEPKPAVEEPKPVIEEPEHYELEEVPYPVSEIVGGYVVPYQNEIREMLNAGEPDEEELSTLTTKMGIRLAGIISTKLVYKDVVNTKTNKQILKESEKTMSKPELAALEKELNDKDTKFGDISYDMYSTDKYPAYNKLMKEVRDWDSFKSIAKQAIEPEAKGLMEHYHELEKQIEAENAKEQAKKQADEQAKKQVKEEPKNEIREAPKPEVKQEAPKVNEIKEAPKPDAEYKPVREPEYRLQPDPFEGKKVPGNVVPMQNEIRRIMNADDPTSDTVFNARKTLVFEQLSEIVATKAIIPEPANKSEEELVNDVLKDKGPEAAEKFKKELANREKHRQDLADSLFLHKDETFDYMRAKITDMKSLRSIVNDALTTDGKGLIMRLAQEKLEYQMKKNDVNEKTVSAKKTLNKHI